MAAEYMPQTEQLLEAASANIDLHIYRFLFYHRVCLSMALK
jgi:hypothetical protein